MTFLVSTNAPSRYNDDSFCSQCSLKRMESFLIWPKALNKNFDRLAFWVSKGILWQWEGSRTISRKSFLKWHEGFGFFGFWIFLFDLVNLKALCGTLGGQEGLFCFYFWPCGLTSYMWQVRGSGFGFWFWPCDLTSYMWQVKVLGFGFWSLFGTILSPSEWFGFLWNVNFNILA